jgi:hypothetical protein
LNCRLILAMAMIAIGSAQMASPEDRDVIPPYSLELERRLQPWCPGDCVDLVPFTAKYQKGEQTLVFVGAHHVFTPRNSTFRAVASGFSLARPKVLIVEGFPTAMGENPPPLVKEAQQFGTPQTGEFSRGEAMYAASLALRRGIPFLGGEPDPHEEIPALQEKGFKAPDIAFAFLARGLSQAFHADEALLTDEPKLASTFSALNRWNESHFGLPSLSFGDFALRYRSEFGIDFKNDKKLVSRMEPSADTATTRLFLAGMTVRDEHLLAVINEQLLTKKRVLIVYGGSHWTTLSQALERRFGKPAIAPFQR